jgi:hypothetical protein
MPTARSKSSAPKAGTTKPTSRRSSTRARPTASNESAAVEGQTRPNSQAPASPGTFPSWDDWAQRPTVSVYSAVCLAHNIKADSKVVTRLKGEGDGRARSGA